MKIKANAKINLTLDVTGKRPDGYHTIETIMQSVSLYDSVEVLENNTNKIHVSCNEQYIPTDKTNTAFLAASHFMDHCNLDSGIDIDIHKEIPSRAGLGGGSADAAAVILILNQIFEQKLSLSELEIIGAKVGADVPFCLSGGTSLCTGIGDKVTPLKPLPDCIIVICKPPAGVSTPRAYSLIDQYPTPKEMGTPIVAEALGNGGLKRIARNLQSRFNDVVRLDAIKKIKRDFAQSGAMGSLMTGSGSAVYGIFKDAAKAELCAELLKAHGDTFVTKPQKRWGVDCKDILCEE